MKTRKTLDVSGIVLKNAMFWNDQKFEHRDEVCLGGDKGAAKSYDCKGALVMPALFGLGLDFMEPLRDDVYTFKNGFDAMRLGGFYGGLYESAANPIDDADKMIAMKLRFASCEGEAESCANKFNIKFLGAYSKGFGTDSLAEMMELAEEGVVGFGDGNAAIPHTRFLRLAMEYGKMTDKRFFFQPLDKTLRKNGCVHEGAYSDMLGMKGIPRIAETIAAYTVLEAARFLQVPVHFKQVTCGETLDLIRNARKQGIDVTCDVGLHHLLLNDSCLETLDSAYHLIPPLRSAADCESLWKGIEDGTVNAISVNHTPVLRQDTEVNFEDSVPGALSLEIALPAIWKKLSERVGDARAIELLSYAPARLVGAETAVNDVVVLSADAPHKVAEKDFAGHVCNSPFLGKELPSSILGTYINGVWTELA
jgi:dihydroorotase